MKKSERNVIIKHAETITDEELEREYYDFVYNSLGSQVEKMYDLEYDLIDIKEREQYEEYLSQKSDLLEQLCCERNIKLWATLNRKNSLYKI